MKIQRALISVYDKEGAAEFAKGLSDEGIEIISSGGSANLLMENGIPVTRISDYTGFPQMMDGRVKTLHPKVHGGILANRSKEEHMRQAKDNDIGMIDLVAVNLYPFEETIKTGSLEDAIEKIDIGGPSLIRAAAKNYKDVATIIRPERYEKVLSEIRSDGSITDETRKVLALEAWEHISHYDAVIENYFREQFGYNDTYPEYLNLSMKKKQDLRYGENPHQSASFYLNDNQKEPSISNARQLQGKELSYNNILDGNAALELLKEFEEPTAVVVKHNNPSGVASDDDILEAYKTARSVDPEAAFGGVVTINLEIGEELAKEITSKFVEMVIAPSFSDGALEIFSKKKKLRIMETGELNRKREPFREYRSVVGGLLVQDANLKLHDGQFNVVTKRKPSDEEMASMKYAWKVCKYVKSNSIVYARPKRVVGIGAGQMKRVDAANLAAMIADEFGLELDGCAMASDAFFPFRDGIDAAAKRGVTSVIEPGGSIRDQEVIDAADEHGMTMVFTGVRHFRH
jgi:phosphoribosylaminoimidazolecarboxamide formyltransferase/IMP cyclohydrolase